MKASALKYFIISLLASLISVIIVLMPFHAFLTVWGSSLVGHYTVLRLWKEFLLAVAAVGALYLLLMDIKVRTQTLTRRLLWLIAAYLAWLLVRSLIALAHHSVTHKALAYGDLVDSRFLLFFLIAWMVAVRTKQLPAQWQRLLLWPAFGVIGFALLQFFFLPHNFLSHFGYVDGKTIPPIETINHNNNYIRVASTLRGANPLGAYLILPISLLTVYVLTPLKRNRSHIVVLPLALAALFCSFSRSAWIGAFLAMAVIVTIRLKHLVSQKLFALTGVAFVLLIGVAFALHDSASFQNVVLHTESHSAVKTTSNHGHAAALESGVKDLWHEPFGEGPGTAGPASVYDNGHVRLAEDFYLQLGQEAGWVAIGLFILINVGVGYLLWTRRADPLALSLFAALIGLSVVNLLAHAWADDTLAYVWWGLAGIAMAQPAMTEKQLKKHHA